MSNRGKFHCLDQDCGWSGPVPGADRACKRCGGPTERRFDDTISTRVLESLCEYTGLPYDDVLKDNPIVRKYRSGEFQYALIYRNKKFVNHIYCPNCNKLLSTNAKMEGEYDTVCKNKLPAEKGGGKCGVKVKIVFYTQKFKEVNRGPVRVERPSTVNQGARNPVRPSIYGKKDSE